MVFTTVDTRVDTFPLSPALNVHWIIAARNKITNGEGILIGNIQEENR